MKTVTFTDFRKNASELFTAVEHGETLLVLRHGKPITEVSPASGSERRTPSWKRPGLRLAAKGASLSAAILQERRREDVFLTPRLLPSGTSKSPAARRSTPSVWPQPMSP